MNAQSYKEFFMDPQMREVINWKGLERVTGLRALRIKNVCMGRGGNFRTDEVEKLNAFFHRFNQMLITDTEHTSNPS